MASNLSRTPSLFNAGALLTSSLLLFLGTGLHPAWWAVWLAPLPILLIAPRLNALPAFGTAALAWVLGGLNMWHYMRDRIEIPIPIVLLAIGTPALVFGLAVLAYRVRVRRQALWQAVLVVPTLWVTYEYLYSITSPHSTFGNIAYTQMDCLPVVQFASVAGIWGISFCLFLFSVAVAAMFSKLGSKSQRFSVALAAGGFLVAVFAYGFWRLHFTPAGQQSASILLIATDAREHIFPHSDEATVKLAREYSEQIAQLSSQLKTGSAASNNLAIILPEKIGVISDQGVEELDHVFEQTAVAAKANIFVGVDHGTQTQRVNEERVYAPDGSLEATYVKHHLVPKFEDVDQPGTQRTLLSESSGLWGVQICKDMDFPQLSRQYGRQRVDLLLVSAWDFVLDDWLHNRMAVLRGVENGFPIARTAKQGLLTVSDDRGRILAQESSAAKPFSYLIASVPVRHDSTLYSRWGDWFAWLCVIGMLIALFSSTSPRAKNTAPPHNS